MGKSKCRCNWHCRVSSSMPATIFHLTVFDYFRCCRMLKDLGLVCDLLSMAAEQVMDMQSLASLVGFVCDLLSMHAEQRHGYVVFGICGMFSCSESLAVRMFAILY